MIFSFKYSFIATSLISGLLLVNAVKADTSDDVKTILRRLNQLENEITSLKKQLKEKTEAANKTSNLSENNFYVSAGVGVLGDSYFNDSDNQAGAKPFLDTPLEGFWSGEFGIGYKFTNNLRGEISYSANVLRDNTTYDGAVSYLGSDWVDNHSLFMSAYYDFSNESKFTPYLGIGLGPSLIDTDQVFGCCNKPSEVTLGYQGKLGFSYEAFDSTDLFLEGTYQSTKAFKKGLYQIDPMEMFSTRLGLRYKF